MFKSGSSVEENEHSKLVKQLIFEFSHNLNSEKLCIIWEDLQNTEGFVPRPEAIIPLAIVKVGEEIPKIIVFFYPLDKSNHAEMKKILKLDDERALVNQVLYEMIKMYLKNSKTLNAE